MAAGVVPETADYVNSVKQKLFGSAAQRDTMTGLIIYVRAKPSSETEFAQVILPVALSYETFVCKLCVALGVQREMVKKIVKLPDILIRTTEDVIRLSPFEKLELVLHRSMWKHTIRNKWKSVQPWCSLWSWTMLFAFTLSAAVDSNNLVKRLDEFVRTVENLTEKMKFLEDKLNSKVQTETGQKNSIDKNVKQLSIDVSNLETNLLDNLNEFDKKFDRLNSDQNLLTASLHEFIDQANKMQTAKFVLKRKAKDDS